MCIIWPICSIGPNFMKSIFIWPPESHSLRSFHFTGWWSQFLLMVLFISNKMLWTYYFYLLYPPTKSIFKEQGGWFKLPHVMPKVILHLLPMMASSSQYHCIFIRHWTNWIRWAFLILEAFTFPTVPNPFSENEFHWDKEQTK